MKTADKISTRFDLTIMWTAQCFLFGGSACYDHRFPFFFCVSLAMLIRSFYKLHKITKAILDHRDQIKEVEG